jgi:outer membrane protein assembly factor BamB
MSRLLQAFALGTCVMIAAGCSTLDAINPFSTTVAKIKPAELGTIQATRDLRQRWQGNVGKAGEFRFTPAVVGGSVYAASRDGTIARFDNGHAVWRVSAGQVISGGVGSDGQRVVVGTAKGEVLAFDAANGRELWRARVSSEVLAAPVVVDGMAVVRSGDSRIYALEAADGKRRWVYQRSTPTLSLRSAVSVLVDGRVTLAGFPGGKLVAIANNNGAAVWEVTVALPKGATELERVADITSNPVVNNNVVCAAAFQGRVSCFDTQNGNPLWSKEMSSQNGLDIDARHVYVTDDKGAVHAFDRTRGASVWRQDKLFLRGVTRPLAQGEVIAVGDYQGYVHLLRREDGAFVGRLATDGSAVQSELIPQDKDGFVMQTANGGVFALETR